MIEPVWIDARDALALHERLLSIHGGAEGLRDLAVLHQVVARKLNILNNENHRQSSGARHLRPSLKSPGS